MLSQSDRIRVVTVLLLMCTSMYVMYSTRVGSNAGGKQHRRISFQRSNINISGHQVKTTENPEIILRSNKNILKLLADVAKIPPSVMSTSATAPPLPPRPNCKGLSGLTGELLARPRKLIHLFTLAFEIDTLEIVLREEHDIVDKIFIVEATKTHHPQVEKPLMWDEVKATERFSFLDDDKVVHVVVDDVDAMNQDKSKNIWSMELQQYKVGVDKVKEWATATVTGGIGVLNIPSISTCLKYLNIKSPIKSLK